jgi:hypothetical protein
VVSRSLACSLLHARTTLHAVAHHTALSNLLAAGGFGLPLSGESCAAEWDGFIRGGRQQCSCDTFWTRTTGYQGLATQAAASHLLTACPAQV